MRRSVQRLVITFLTFVLCTLYFVLPVQAQTHSASSGQANPYLQPSTNPDVPKDLNTYTQSVLLNVLASVSCQLTGIDPLHIDPTTGTASQKCLGYDQTTGKIGFVEGGNGVAGVLGHFISIMYTPPTSTGEYLAYMGGKFGIAEPAYAQGIGFKGISPIVKIWEGFRNITYIAFVIVFVGIGFMIMLRVKIDPRTVMTIQNSIPKVIIGLVLVTFSFAISGFLIDMMYLGTSVGTNLLANMADDDTKKAILQVPQATNPFEAANTIGGAGIATGSVIPTGGFLTFPAGPAESIGTVTGNAVNDFKIGEFPLGRTIVGGVTAAIGKIFGAQLTETLLGGLLGRFGISITDGPASPIGGAIAAISKGSISNLVAGIFGVIGFAFAPQIAQAIGFFIAFLILTIAVIWALARVWIQLLQAYIWILINIVTAPLWIIGGMFPGSPVSFSEWMRDMGAQLSTFPTTIAMLVLAKVFMGAFKDKQELFVPPLVGPQDANIIAPFIGIGFIFLMPVVNQMVKDAFKAPKFPYGAAVGQAIGVSTGLGGALATTAYSPYGFLAQIKTGPLKRFFGEKGPTTVAPHRPQQSESSH